MNHYTDQALNEFNDFVRFAILRLQDEDEANDEEFDEDDEDLDDDDAEEEDVENE